MELSPEAPLPGQKPPEAPAAAPPEAAEAFLGIMQARWACKLFDPSRPVDRSLLDCLLESIRLSPSSFGLEHTRVVAVVDGSLRADLARASGGQDPMATAPLVLVLMAPRAAAYAPDSAFVAARASRFPGGLPAFRADYEGYYEFLIREGRLEAWARAQSYLALGNAMTAGAAACLDSCAIEGFDEGQVLDALGCARQEWMACLMAAFGYSAEPRRERFRLPLEEMSEIR